MTISRPESKKSGKTRSEPIMKNMIEKQVMIQVTKELKKVKHDPKRKN